MPVSNHTKGEDAKQNNKRRGRFRLRRVLGALLVVLLLLLIAAVLLHRAIIRAYAPTILNSLAGQFETYYDLELTWDGYSVTGLNDFTIAGVSLKDIPTDTQLLSIDSIRVRSSLFALAIRGRDPVQGVTSVELDNPSITLGRRDGRWNTGKLLEPATGEAFEFPGRLGIVIRDGNIEWLGGDVADGYPLPPSRIAGLQGVYRLSSDGGAGFKLDGTFSGAEMEPSPIEVQGTYDPKLTLIHLNIHAASLDLGLVRPLLAKHFQELGGVADTSVSILVGPPAGELGYSVLGSARVSDGRAVTDFLNISASKVAGDLQFSHESIFTSGLTGTVEGGTVTVRGRVADFSHESLTTDLAIEAENLPASYVRKELPALDFLSLEGSFSGRGEVSTFEDGLEAAVSVHSPAVSVFSVPSALTDFFGWYTHDSFVVRQLDLDTCDGTVKADGVVNLSEEDAGYEFRVTGNGLSSEKLASYFSREFPSSLIPSGAASGDLRIAASGGRPMSIAGLIRGDGIRLPIFAGLPGASATVPVEFLENTLHINGATAIADGATLLADGAYRIGRGFEGKIALTVDDPALLGKVSGAPIQGAFAAACDLTYSPRNGFNFTGDAALTNADFGPISAPSLAARVSFDGKALRVWDISGIIADADIAGELTVPISPDAAGLRSGLFSVRGLNVGPMLAGGYSQAVSTSIDISGDISWQADERALRVDMTVTEDSARLGPNILSTNDKGIDVVIDIPVRNRGKSSLLVSGVLKSAPAASPVYRGRALTPYSERLVREITNLLAGRLAHDTTPATPLLPTISGTVDIQANLTGPCGDLHGTIDATTGNLEVSGVAFASAALHLDGLEGTKWDIGVTADALDAGVFEVTGQIERAPTITESTLMLSAAIRDSGIRTLIGLLGFPGLSQTSGKLSGSGLIEGTLSDPSIDDFRFSLGESEALGIPLKSGEGSFSYDSPMLNVTGLEVNGNDGFRVLGAGAVDVESPSLTDATLVLRVDGLDLQVISGAMGKPFPLAGVASATVQLAQDALGPRILYDAKIESLAFRRGEASLPIGNLTLKAESRPGDAQVNVKSLELNRDGEAIVVFGLAPLKFNDAGADLFDLSVDCENGYSLATPPGFFGPQVAWDGGLGAFHLAFTGSIATPNLSGEINLGFSNIRIYDTAVIRSIAGTMDVRDSVVTASPDRVLVTGDGWQVGLDGKADLNALFKYEISVDSGGNHLLDGVQIASVAVEGGGEGPIPLKGPGFELQLRPGTPDNPPRITAKGRREGIEAVVTGNISVVGGQVDIAKLRFPVPDPNAAPPPSPLSFDLHTNLLAGLRVQDGNMFNLVFEEAQIDVGGNLTYPVVTGNLLAPDGWLDLFGNHFVLTQPLEMKLSSLYPPTDPYVKATGQAHLREVGSPGMLGQDLVVTAVIDGRLSNRTDSLLLTSNPPLSQDQLIAALAYEDVVFRTVGNTLFGDNPLGGGIGDVDFSSMVLPFAASYISRYIRREAGFTDFELSLDRNRNIRIFLEKEVFDNMVMYYTQKFGPDAEDDYLFGARYRWRRRSWVGVELNSDEEITPQVEYIIPLD